MSYRANRNDRCPPSKHAFLTLSFVCRDSGQNIAFITECSNTGTRDQPTADRPVAARLRPPEPARAPEPDAESEPEIVEADLDSDDERVIERMKARHEHVIERMKAGRAFGEAEVAAREREYAGTRAHVAAAKAFIAACKAERAAASLYVLALSVLPPSVLGSRAESVRGVLSRRVAAHGNP